MTASTQYGILLMTGQRIRTASNSQMPCVNDDSRVRAPASALAELLTMTAVMGKPPARPLTKLPAPCATNSLLGGEILLYGSSLSMAVRLSNVSSEATKQTTKALRHTAV